LMKFGRVVFELCEWTDKRTGRQTNKQTDVGLLITTLCAPPRSQKKVRPNTP